MFSLTMSIKNDQYINAAGSYDISLLISHIW